MKTKTNANFFLGLSVAVLAACAGASAPAAPAASASAAAASVDGEWKTLVDGQASPRTQKPERTVLAPGAVCADGKKAGTWTDEMKEGSFTRQGAQEMAYVAHTSGCDPKQPETRRLIVTKKGDSTPLVDKEVAEGVMVEVRDLDADGDNEILLMNETFTNGERVTTARLIDTEDAKFELLYDFGEVARSPCKNGGDAPVILYRMRGKSMDYKAEKRAAPCQ